MTHRLSEHVENPMDKQRLERIWSGIAGRRSEFQGTSVRRRTLAYGSALVVAAGVILGLSLGLGEGPGRGSMGALVDAPSAQAEEGASLRTGSEQMSVGLSDGSRVTLLPRSELTVEETHSDDISLSLAQGRVSLDVEKDKHRIFSVLAGPVTVRVVGTQFSVERERLEAGEKVLVEVTEGIVSVQGPSGVEKRLSAGESWSVRVGEEGPLAAEQPQDAEASSPAKEGKRELHQANKSASLPAGDALPDLFVEARRLRNAGDASGAARVYQEFLNQAPGDPRVGVAALELGRLRMDQLGDVAGAIAPLRQAAQRGAGSLGDDALARLAEAHGKLGQLSACRSTRDSYLKAYPKGVHVEQVRGLCP